MMAAAVKEQQARSRALADQEKNMIVALRRMAADLAEETMADKQELASLCDWLGLPGVTPTCLAVVDPEEVARKSMDSTANIKELHTAWQRRHTAVTPSLQQDFSNLKGFKGGPCFEAGVCHCRGPARVLGSFWSKLRQHLLQLCKDYKQELLDGHMCVLLAGQRPEQAQQDWHFRCFL